MYSSCDITIAIVKMDIKAIFAISTSQCEQSCRNAMNPFVATSLSQPQFMYVNEPLGFINVNI